MNSQGHNWTVLAAGPSLAEMDPAEVASRPNVVAVNRAFYWIEGRCHAWCVNENPGKIWHTMGGARTHELVDGSSVELWIPRAAWFKAWKLEFPAYPHFVGYDRNKSRLIQNKRFTSPGWDTKLLWSNGTTNVALALCCAKGAKDITLLGCDQRGRGGWGYSFSEEANSRWKKRWTLERTAIEWCIREASDHGVRIHWERVGSL